jgi:alpha-D-ribose 1-methylphosphonate 5-triphosphate diphosphatase
MTTILCNAKLVLSDRVLPGSVKLESGLVTEINEGVHVCAHGIDMEGCYLIPGLVDLHSDNMEKTFAPRPNVKWPPLGAALAHDAAVIGSGITTVLNSLSLAGMSNGVDRAEILQPMIEGLELARGRGALRAQHFLELRCEIGKADIVDRYQPFARNPLVRVVSLMDHMPGQRQYTTREMWLAAYRPKTLLSEEALEARMEQGIAERDQHGPANYLRLAKLAHDRNVPIASHDDSTIGHVDEAVAAGAAISQFPTTAAAASRAHGLGLAVLMGAPNIVRKKSHVGNLSAEQCAMRNELDILASDYVPASLLHAAFVLTKDPVNMPLPQAIAIVSRNPASAVALEDRGVIEIGKRADLVQVHDDGSHPIVRQVWSAGRRVH